MKTSVTTLPKFGWADRLALLAIAVLSVPLASCESRAENLGVGESKTAQGTVHRLTTAPLGEIDGEVLDDGTVIHWPPHQAVGFSAIVNRGDRIRATGRLETTPVGETHLEILSVTNLGTGDSRTSDALELHPAARRILPAPPAEIPAPVTPAASARTVEGTVANLTTAPMGEIDGAVLDEGTVIHWPPHLAGRFSPVVVLGERVRVTGFWETGPAGDSHLEVMTATSLRTSASAGTPLSGAPPRVGARRLSEDSGDFAATSQRSDALERRVKVLEAQISELRQEIQKLRNEL
jgi:hypothetical protein